MVQAMDHGAIEGATDDASGGSRSFRWSDEWCKRWIRKLKDERWMDQRPVKSTICVT